MTRANAQVFSTRQDLINARGLREEQEAILKNVLTRTGNEDPEVRAARIIPTDTLTIPGEGRDPAHPGPDHRGAGEPARPGAGAACRSRIRRSAWQGAQQRHAAGGGPGGRHAEQRPGRRANPLRAGHRRATYIGGYGGVLGQVLARNYPTYGVGLQVTLPHPQPHRRSRPGARRDTGEAVADPAAAVAEPGAAGSGGRADRHAPRAGVV